VGLGGIPLAILSYVVLSIIENLEHRNVQNKMPL
jgi:hypothetical protein